MRLVRGFENGGLLMEFAKPPRRNFRGQCPDLLLLEMFRPLAYIDLHVVAFVIFHGVGVAARSFLTVPLTPPGPDPLLI